MSSTRALSREMVMFRLANEATAFDWYGLAISDHTAGLDVSSSVATIEVAPGVRHPRAWSDRSDKYYVVMEGQLRFAVGDDTAELTVGDVCIVRQGEIFDYANRETRPARLVLIHTPAFQADAEHVMT